MSHTTVLLNESIDGLSLQRGDVLLDGTFNDGGHSLEAIKRLGGNLRVVGIDLDEDALSRARARFSKEGYRVSLYNDNFRNMDRVVEEEGLSSVDGIILDLGFSSVQLEESGRGFSFQKDEPLLMTLSKDTSGLNARTIVNEWEREHLEAIIRFYGEEPAYKVIARTIIEAREGGPLETARDLAALIERRIKRRGKIHPATKTFQALRIAVNDEIEALREGLEKGFQILSSNGRFAVISFHSLEDRIVKRFFRSKVENGEASYVHKKPVTAGEAELKENPRARSAKLRIISKN